MLGGGGGRGGGGGGEGGCKTFKFLRGQKKVRSSNPW